MERPRSRLEVTWLRLPLEPTCHLLLHSSSEMEGGNDIVGYIRGTTQSGHGHRRAVPDVIRGRKPSTTLFRVFFRGIRMGVHTACPKSTLV